MNTVLTPHIVKQEAAQFFGEAVCVEHRYIADIVEGISEYGSEVR